MNQIDKIVEFDRARAVDISGDARSFALLAEYVDSFGEAQAYDELIRVAEYAVKPCDSLRKMLIELAVEFDNYPKPSEEFQATATQFMWAVMKILDEEMRDA